MEDWECHAVGRSWKNKKGEFHREDGPAVIYNNGIVEWWWNGMRHRLDGPAIDRLEGYTEEIEWARIWCRYGQIHREDGPAVERNNGTVRWYWSGKELPITSLEELEALKPELIVEDIQEM